MVTQIITMTEGGVPRVADDLVTTLALRKPPVDDILAQRPSSSPHVAMTVTVWSQLSPVVNLNLSRTTDILCFFSVKLCHFILVSLEFLWMAVHKTRQVALFRII